MDDLLALAYVASQVLSGVRRGCCCCCCCCCGWRCWPWPTSCLRYFLSIAEAAAAWRCCRRLILRLAFLAFWPACRRGCYCCCCCCGWRCWPAPSSPSRSSLVFWPACRRGCCCCCCCCGWRCWPWPTSRLRYFLSIAEAAAAWRCCRRLILRLAFLAFWPACRRGCYCCCCCCGWRCWPAPSSPSRSSLVFWPACRRGCCCCCCCCGWRCWPWPTSHLRYFLSIAEAAAAWRCCRRLILRLAFLAFWPACRRGCYCCCCCCCGWRCWPWPTSRLRYFLSIAEAAAAWRCCRRLILRLAFLAFWPACRRGCYCCCCCCGWRCWPAPSSPSRSSLVFWPACRRGCCCCCCCCCGWPCWPAPSSPSRSPKEYKKF